MLLAIAVVSAGTKLQFQVQLVFDRLQIRSLKRLGASAFRMCATSHAVISPHYDLSIIFHLCSVNATCMANCCREQLSQRSNELKELHDEENFG